MAASACLVCASSYQISSFPDHDFAVEHGAFGQRGAQGGEFGEAVGHQFFAARPDEDLAIAHHQLRANAVPLPLDLPLRGRAQQFVEARQRLVERVRQVERVGLAAARAQQRGPVGRRGEGAEVGRRGPGAGLRVAHQALGDEL